MSSSPASTLTRETVLTLAPDPAAAKAGERLGGAGNWSGLGMSGDVLWGACRGSGSKPYQVVALAGVEFAATCTCPSRKFPCKHVLGLLFLASAGPGVLPAGAEPPEWVAGWLARRDARAQAARTRAAQHAAAGGDPAGAAGPNGVGEAAGSAGKGGRSGASGRSGSARSTSAARAKREARVDDGVAELNRWLTDVARDGLGSAQTQPARWWEGIAARMVDAQAPGLAELVRDMARVAAAGGPDWPDRLTDRLGRLHLLCEGWVRRADLPPALVEVLYDRIGFTQATADVLSGERRTGPVDVLGERLFQAGKLRGRRQWLRLVESGQLAQTVTYGAGSQPPATGLPVLFRVEAEVAAYAGRRPTRIALAGATGAAAPVTDLASADPGQEPPGASAATWREALAAHAATLAADPWADPVAFVVRRLTVLPPAEHPVRAASAGRAQAGRGAAGSGTARWLLRDSDGDALPLAVDAEPWGWWLLAVGGGHPLDLAVEWDGFALTPLSAAPARRPGQDVDPSSEGTHPAAAHSDTPATGTTSSSAPTTAVAAAGAGAGEREDLPAVRPIPGWSQVVDAAVVGTARAAVPGVPALTALLPDAARGPTSPGGTSAAGELLRIVALIAVARRAGSLPAPAGGLSAPVPAGPDPMPVLPSQVSQVVEGALAGSLSEARAQCLELMAEHGWRAPDQLLGDLLTLGLRESDLRVAIGRVLGVRGRWLAAMHPDGRWMGQVTVEAWPTASTAERRMLVRDLRQRDPAAAVALLRGPADGPAFTPFDQASGAERLAFCDALRVGLGSWDVELVEHALDDRRADVRAAAVAVALLLPGSGLETRAAARTAGLLTVSRLGIPGRHIHRLRFDTPAGLTAEMRRDGISESGPRLGPAEARVALLTAELARVDPAVWAERAGLTPAQFLAADVTIAGMAHRPATYLRRALLPVVARHRHPDWVLALLPHLVPAEQAHLIGCLPEPARTEALALALRAHRMSEPGRRPGTAPPSTARAPLRTPGAQVATLLAAVPGPWSPQFSQAALEAVVALLTRHAAEVSALPHIRHLLAVTAWRLDLETDLDSLHPRPSTDISSTDGSAPDPFVAERAEMRAVLEARRRLRAVLTSPPEPDSAAEPTRPARLVQEGHR